jgi:hypothetical protein
MPPSGAGWHWPAAGWHWPSGAECSSVAHQCRCGTHPRVPFAMAAVRRYANEIGSVGPCPNLRRNLSHLRRDLSHLRRDLPHLRRDWAHICAGTRPHPRAGIRDRSCAAWVRCARDSPALGPDEAGKPLGACLVQWTRSSHTWTGTRARSSRATGTSARMMRPIRTSGRFPLTTDPAYGRSHLSGSLVSG